MNNDKTKGWFVYILRCADGSLYTGVTTDVTRRLRQHNGELVGGAKYTLARRPCQLAYSEVLASRSLACKREAAIKRFERRKKILLIENGASKFSPLE